MNKNPVHLWIVIGLGGLMLLSISAVNVAAGQSLPATSTPQAAFSSLVQEVANRTGVDPSLVSDMLAAGIPVQEINQENAREWPAHLAMLSEQQHAFQQSQNAGNLDITGLDAVREDFSPGYPTAEDLLWQQIEKAYLQGDFQSAVTLAEGLTDTLSRERWLADISGKTVAGSAPQGRNFIGINGDACAYSTWTEALAAANEGDTLYIDQGTWNDQIGEISKDLTIVAAQNNCQNKASGGVIIDADGGYNSLGGVATITSTVSVTFTNLILTYGIADFGGILYGVNSNIVLDGTDLTSGIASSGGGCLRLLDSTAVMRNGSEIIDCTTSSSASGGGVMMENSHLLLYDTSRIGDYHEGNYSGGSGGGVLIDGGELILNDNSRIRSNQAIDYGGGIFAMNGATVILKDSANIGYIFSTANNNAVDGAGVYLDGDGASLIMEDDSSVQYNIAAGYGGGVFVEAGSRLSMNRASIMYNRANIRGGGIYTEGAAIVELENGSLVAENYTTDELGTGGGMYIYGAGGTITVTNSSILTNTAYAYGGIRLFGGAGSSRLTLESNSNVSFNKATTGDGGGIGILYGVVNVIDSSLAYNSTPLNGGAVNITNGTLNLIDSHIDFNTAAQYGGGIYNSSGEIEIACQNSLGTVSHNTAIDGGGIFDTSGNVLLIDGSELAPCTIGNNTASQNGGGIHLDKGTTLYSRGAVAYHNNIAQDNGGAIYMAHDASAYFSDADAGSSISAFTNNRASTGSGGAIFATTNSQVALYGAMVGGAAGNMANNGSGGGIFIDNSTLDLINAKVINNQALQNGGGIAAYGSSVLINSYYANTPVAKVNSSQFPITNPCTPGNLPANKYCSEISSNLVEGGGGGLFLYDSVSKIENTAILTNTADTGAAVEIFYGSLDLRNTLIAANDADNWLNPAIIYIYSGAGPSDTAELLATHNTIADNLGTGIVYGSNAVGEFHNNIVWGNNDRGSLSSLVEATCNDTQDGVLTGTGNISSDPLFLTTARGAYRLSHKSPVVNQCIDHGLSIDLDGVIRPWAGVYDMGAFEAIIVFLPMVIR